MRGTGAGFTAVLVLAAATATAAEREVQVLRGTGSPPPRAAVDGPPPLRALAGERLWILDEAGGKLVACRLERTSRVAERRIRCAERRLVPTRS